MKYFVTVEYTMFEDLVIEAKSEEEAKEIAYKNNRNIKVVEVEQVKKKKKY